MYINLLSRDTLYVSELKFDTVIDVNFCMEMKLNKLKSLANVRLIICQLNVTHKKVTFFFNFLREKRIFIATKAYSKYIHT